MKTVGEALQDPTTAIAKAVVQTTTDRNERIRMATEISERDGITLEDALVRVWNSTSFSVAS
jgi:hypothetical protein